MEKIPEVFVGIDAAKSRNAVAVADGDRGGEVRYLGEFDADEASMVRVVKRLAGKYEQVHFCYEAGPTGYGLYRLIQSMGHDCTVVTPSLIPRKPGDHVKTNRSDATGLARLLRAGELTAVWVPTKDTRRCATWCVPVLRRSRLNAFTASRSAHSCSSTVGPFQFPAHRRRIAGAAGNAGLGALGFGVP